MESTISFVLKGGLSIVPGTMGKIIGRCALDHDYWDSEPSLLVDYSGRKVYCKLSHITWERNKQCTSGEEIQQVTKGYGWSCCTVYCSVYVTPRRNTMQYWLFSLIYSMSSHFLDPGWGGRKEIVFSYEQIPLDAWWLRQLDATCCYGDANDPRGKWVRAFGTQLGWSAYAANPS